MHVFSYPTNGFNDTAAEKQAFSYLPFENGGVENEHI